MHKRILHLLAISLLASQFLYAQVTTSSINGTIRGTRNESLAGATVSAVHQPSGTVYNASTTANGQFTIPNMRVGGPYSITVTYVGQQPSRFDDIYLKLGEPYILNATLRASDAALSEVVVSATNRNSILNANRTGATTNVGSRQIQTLPTISRSLNDFIRLTPQASSTSNGSIGGGNYRQNYITVDGSDFNNTFGIGTNLPANGSPISLDAIEEISINVTPFDIKQSGFIGSAINAVTRSGTNSYSGSIYSFLRTENQQGNKVGYNTPLVRQNLSVNTYGFRVGGPIIKNKLFFFLNGESGATIQPGQQNVAATTYTAGQPGAFGFSPNISRPTAGFLDTVSRYLRETYNYETGPYQNYDNESNNTRFVARLDWNINTKNRFNIRYSQVESKSPSFVSTSRSPLAAYSTSQGRQSNTALWFKNSNYFQEANFYSLSAELNSTIGRFANTFRGTFTHQNDPRSTDSEVFPFVDILDGSGGNPGVPLTSFGFEPFSFGNLRDVKTTSFVDYLTWTSSKHNFTAGGQVDISSTRNGFQRFGTSYYTFRSWNDFISGVKPVDFAITYPLNEKFEQAFPRFKFAQYSLYAQDEISVTPNFRLTAGLRVDLPHYLDVAEIKTHPIVDTLVFANGERINTGVLPKSRVLWSPRLGFNWDVRGDRSLQLRGGSGIFTGRVPTVWIVAQSGDAGLLQFTQVYETPAANRNNPAAFVTPGPFNPSVAAYRPATLPAIGSQVPSTISAIDPDFKFPQTWKSSIALDSRLPWGLVGTLELIYNQDLNIAVGRNPNLVDPQPLNVAGYADNRPIYPAAVTDKFLYPLTPATAATAPSTPVRRGNAAGTQAFNPVVLDNASGGYYFSATARLDKQFTRNFSASVAYTRSQAKNLYDGSGDQLLNTWSLTQITNNSNIPELGYAGYIVPDRVIAALSYRKEYLKHLGTTFSLFFEGSSAGRFSYTYTSDFNRDGQTNDLIYVPKDASEITFVDQTYGSGSSAVTYTAKQQSDLFFRYMEQDKYLSSRRGKYAERNGATLPWRNQVDVKLVQDLFTNVGGKRNTVQFTLDVFNFGNLLNSNWGVVRTINTSAILQPRNTGALTPGGTTKPTFSLASDRNVPATSTTRLNNSIVSTYYMQFGFRYIFN